MDNTSRLVKNAQAARPVAVFGAYGHTGRFVVAALTALGYAPVAVGRDASKLQMLTTRHPGLDPRLAVVDDAGSLSRAFAGAGAVINCAGPFASTAARVIEASLAAGVPYVDVAAEIEANVDTFSQFSEPADRAGLAMVPAMAFFGGLGDLLATTAMGDWHAADEVHLVYGLSRWHPTPGTRAASAVSRQRRHGRGVRYTRGQLRYESDAPPRSVEWTFPAPFGTRTVIGDVTMTDVVTISSHLSVPEIHCSMTAQAVEDVTDPTICGPVPSDDLGRSEQTFVVEVVVRKGCTERRVAASGQDIYAISASLAVEAVHRILNGRTTRVGVGSAGDLFDAPEFLSSLASCLQLSPVVQTCARQHFSQSATPADRSASRR